MQKIAVLCFALLLLSCGSGNDIPADIMGIDKMKPIVWDLLRAGSLSDIQYRKDSAHFVQKSTELYQQVFRVYGITKEEFYKSYDYYKLHPDKNKILMDSVMAYANHEREKLFKSAPSDTLAKKPTPRP